MAICYEFWYGREQNKSYNTPIFKNQKRNLPKNYSSPKELKNCLSAIKSEIMDPRNQNQTDCNLPIEELAALKELIRLQRERVIMIKPCDKGAGILILDFKLYMQACYEHLIAKQKNENGEEESYYVQIEDWEIERSKNKIMTVLLEGLDNKIISEE